ncbi:aspartyl/asparaginyl beta-hydroxylase domain-containing protein [Burkholderia oklahomensis]|uniref:Aspartyl/Asparaginyl beta-hydroxylase family protein n=1 Tax=Burkholderia oklahomensis TaxID=342113 RepID=A0AAI8FMR5_9BURK|nr:aspartyl/asparaginyl beta-hydroxylase domain-containing protein [Burkholderia oklahomensis]AIO66090.1 aspartyl/Asparaginyl beta-hydroxylase family protein [Burkholderia oklahomensis]AJX31560.1 aspartyl/Asparaginyl beta-hydroxylase family protein [Burkholderia oklahomensis C6786]MBI0358229.1 aspartyl/asparaginyl beta-hydroxylase domain-containing protein [Burkholderia oklahomensis]QPS36825.1 aspartyl/asparaginyl beta-hydroxylase domain-containing protein [Burkholderia oklahomensis]SUW56154.1
MFYPPELFTAIPAVARGWETILHELDNLAQTAFTKWPETSIYDGNWTVFPLVKAERRIEQNCLLCPQTTRLLESVPGLVNAGFSSLAPGTYIGPHYGYTNEVLRCHVGLKPSENCAIRVGPEVRSWSAGSCLVFDDTTEHEAWNRGTKTRVVLLFDFKRDPSRAVTFPAEFYTY